RDERRAYAARYRLEHADRKKASRIAYSEKNREKIARKQAEYRQTHPEKIRELNARRRAREAQAPRNDFTAPQWQAMKEHYDHRCVYCGRQMQRLTQDHLTPLSQGGPHTTTNIVPACQSCNSRKRAGAVLTPVQPLLLVPC